MTKQREGWISYAVAREFVQPLQDRKLRFVLDVLHDWWGFMKRGIRHLRSKEASTRQSAKYIRRFLRKFASYRILDARKAAHNRILRDLIALCAARTHGGNSEGLFLR